jgi:hypothetical protein
MYGYGTRTSATHSATHKIPTLQPVPSLTCTAASESCRPLMVGDSCAGELTSPPAASAAVRWGDATAEGGPVPPPLPPPCCDDCRRLPLPCPGLPSAPRLCCEASVRDASRPSCDCCSALPLPSSPPGDPRTALPPGRRARKVKRSGVMADLNTLHSEGTSPSSCTDGSRGQGQAKPARSACTPLGDSRPRSASAFLDAAPRMLCRTQAMGIGW